MDQTPTPDTPVADEESSAAVDAGDESGVDDVPDGPVQSADESAEEQVEIVGVDYFEATIGAPTRAPRKSSRLPDMHRPGIARRRSAYAASAASVSWIASASLRPFAAVDWSSMESCMSVQR